MGLVKNQHTRSFNSRSPSGLRHLFAKHRYKFTCFNSRSPSGLRHNFACLLLSFSVSIHAAQAGCDGQTVTVTSTLISFNSRSPSGLRPSCRIYRRAIGCFNSRSPSGLRRRDGGAWGVCKPFQFTQPKRAATGSRHARLYPSRGFNSRSPSGLRQTI